MQPEIDNRAQPECCWHYQQLEAHACPSFRPGDEALLFDRKSRFLHRCLECHLFLRDLQALAPELGDLAQLLPFAIEELLGLRAEIRTLRQLVGHLEQQGDFVREVGQVLQTSLDREEVIAMVLTALTAAEGFGLNRAILLLVDRDQNQLSGHLAVGPRDHADAARIWSEIDEKEFSLREMAQRLCGEPGAGERAKFIDLLQTLTTPMTEESHLFIRTLTGQSSVSISDLQRCDSLSAEQRRVLEVDELLLVPLVSRDRRVGLLLADNLVTERPLDQLAQQTLETFAPSIAFAIERAGLYHRLELELDKTTAAHQRLQEQQKQLIRMEQLALVGQMTADIAHSIRNPLTILAGHARQLAKQNREGDAGHLSGILRESRRLETALQEVLNLIDARHPSVDGWDVNRILTQVYAGLQEDLQLDNLDCRLDLATSLPLLQLDYRQVHSCLQSLMRQALTVIPPGARLLVRSRGAGGGVGLCFSAPGLDQLRPPADGQRSLGLALCARALERQHGRLDLSGLEADPPELHIHFSHQERTDGPHSDC